MSKMSELHAEVQQAIAVSNLRCVWTPLYGGFEFETGGLRLCVTDQRDRGCGYCWHVSAQTGDEDICRGGHLKTAEEAKRAASAFARAYCEATLSALDRAEAS